MERAATRVADAEQPEAAGAVERAATGLADAEQPGAAGAVERATTGVAGPPVVSTEVWAAHATELPEVGEAGPGGRRCRSELDGLYNRGRCICGNRSEPGKKCGIVLAILLR